MHHARFQISRAQLVAIAGTGVDFHSLRRTHTDPQRLHRQHLQQRGIVLVHHHRRAGGRLQFGRSADVINMRVRHHDQRDL